jgi:hypothetical protein
LTKLLLWRNEKEKNSLLYLPFKMKKTEIKKDYRKLYTFSIIVKIVKNEKKKVYN